MTWANYHLHIRNLLKKTTQRRKKKNSKKKKERKHVQAFNTQLIAPPLVVPVATA